MKRQFLAVSFLSIILILFACAGEDSEQTESKKLNLPDQQLDSSKIVFTIKGEKNASLWAEHIFKYNDRDKMIAKNIRVDFEGNPPEGDGILYADSGTVRDSKDIIEVYGNVHLKTERGTELFTNSLKWNTTNDKVTTEDHVLIKRGKERIEGVGLETDVGFNKVILKKQISGELSS
jgi:LPS export ABC transporter protein LptC